MSFKQEAKPSVFDDTLKKTTQNGQGQRSDKKDYLRIENGDPEDFGATIATKYMSTVDIAKKINHLMTDIFDDWYGCLVSNNNGQISCMFYFKPTNAPAEKNSRRAFLPIGGVSKGDSLYDKMNALNQIANKSKNFAMTDYASELLYDVMQPHVAKGGKIDPFNPASYNRVVSEQEVNQLVGATVYCLVSCIDVQRLLAKIYGERSKKDNTKNFYAVSPIRPLNAAPNQQTTAYTNWLCSVTVMSGKEFKETIQAAGVMPNFGDVPAITGTF